MGEIEHFVDPEDKTHERFSEVLGIRLPLLDRQTQIAGSTAPRTVNIEEAVEARTIDNQTLGYFLARIYRFLLNIGVDESKVRFRQHMANEMAHYACDCWDAELLTSYGWIECVGCADRSAYDLTVHSKFTGADLKVKEVLPHGPVRKEVWEATLNKKLAGPKFKKEVDIIQQSVDAIDQSTLETLAAKLDENGVVEIGTITPLPDGRKSVELSSEILTIRKGTRLETTREYTPSVIEPSFGIGRIMYSLLEHVYWYRQQDTARVVRQLHQQFSDSELMIFFRFSHCPLRLHQRRSSSSRSRMQHNSRLSLAGYQVTFVSSVSPTTLTLLLPHLASDMPGMTNSGHPWLLPSTTRPYWMDL